MHSAADDRAECNQSSGFKTLTQTPPSQPGQRRPPQPGSVPLGPLLQQAFGQPVRQELPDSMTALLAKLRY